VLLYITINVVATVSAARVYWTSINHLCFSQDFHISHRIT